LEQSPYNLKIGNKVFARIYATNLFGISNVSYVGFGARIVTLPPAKPSPPITVSNGTDVIVTWGAPSSLAKI
jgi:hypothetical protein